jgi:hypothetical protein
MPSVIKTVTFDAADALVLARFWAAVFGSDVDEESTSDKAYLEAAGWGGPNIWFARVPEGRRPRTGCTSICVPQARPQTRSRDWGSWVPGSWNATRTMW